MKLSKLISLGLSLILTTSVYAKATTAQPIDAAEKTTLSIIAAIDQNEILIGALAKHKNVNSYVTDFANLMIKQHGENLAQIHKMENQLKTGALTSSEATDIAKQGKQDMVKLNALKGKEFGKAYADAMVQGHEGALKLIDDKLMQTANTAEIKTFLTATRATVENHLEHAKKMQEELKS